VKGVLTASIVILLREAAVLIKRTHASMRRRHPGGPVAQALLGQDGVAIAAFPCGRSGIAGGVWLAALSRGRSAASQGAGCGGQGPLTSGATIPKERLTIARSGCTIDCGSA